MQFEVRATINATAEQIFAIYEDVAAWPTWDPEIVSSSLNGAFKAGSTGMLKPTTGPNGKIQITEVTENESFTATSKLPLCTISFAHRLIPAARSTEVVHIVSFTGMLSPLFSRLVGPSIRKGMQPSLDGLKKFAEAAHSSNRKPVQKEDETVESESA